MEFAPGYLLGRGLYRLIDFFHHWYVDGVRHILRAYFTQVGGMDNTFALRITLLHFFEPLYKDYSIVGRILGVVFRSGRIAIAFAAYVMITVLFLVVFVAWIVFPLYFLARILGGVAIGS